MKVKFTKEFIKKVKADPNHWKQPEFILAHENKEILLKEIDIKVNGLLYNLEDLEIIK